VGCALLNAVDPLLAQTNVPPLNVRFLVPEPVAYEDPALTVFPFRSTVPFVCVNILVEPIVVLSWKTQVPPAPLNVTGKSSVLPFDVIVLLPLVAPNVCAPVPALNVIPEDTVRSPYIVLALLVSVPEKPVKFMFLWFPVRLRLYVPAVKL
jgi:hypothetical protein